MLFSFGNLLALRKLCITICYENYYVMKIITRLLYYDEIRNEEVPYQWTLQRPKDESGAVRLILGKPRVLVIVMQ